MVAGYADRRRARPAPRLRPHDRRRQRALRPGRAARRLVRRRLRRRPAARPRRAQEGQGDLVPVPPVRRAAGARHGAGQHRRAARPARGGDRRLVPRDARALPLRAAADQGELQRRRGRYGGIQQLAHDANLLFYVSEEAQEGRNAYKEKRAPDFSRFPRRP